MSTSPIVRKDEGTQTTPPPEAASLPGTIPSPGTAPSPETTPMAKHDVTSQSPAPSLLHPERQTDEVPGTSADETAAPAGTGIEASPKEIPLLGPVPDDFGPAYDYLGKVKKMADEIEPGLYETYFEGQFTQGRTRIGFYGYDGVINIIEFGNARKEMLNTIKYLREDFHRASKRGQTVLLVEAINKFGIQAIGMAFDVNPCFFASHLLPKDNTCQWTDKLDKLGRRFESDVLSQSGVDSLKADGMRYWATGNTNYASAKTDRRTSQSPADDCRITIGDETIGFCSRFFDAQRSRNSWIILVDPPVPLYHNGFGPFNQYNMAPFAWQYLPGRLDATLSTEDSRCSLFDHMTVIFESKRPALHDSDRIHADNMLDLLIGHIILETWQHNVQSIEGCFNDFRHVAIASPSLKSFRVFTRLRRSFADIEDAIRAAKYNFSKSTDHMDLEKLFEESDAKPERTEVQYDHLLEKIKVLNTVLNNEIQLVIGSVTVQDSAIMKKQAERATLLTILAVIYLPLTLVTGIFGMNIRQIDSATTEFWAALVGLAVISGITAAGYFGYRHWHRRHDAQDLEAQKQKDMVYKIA